MFAYIVAMVIFQEGPMIHSGAIVAAGLAHGRVRLWNKELKASDTSAGTSFSVQCLHALVIIVLNSQSRIHNVFQSLFSIRDYQWISVRFTRYSELS